MWKKLDQRLVAEQGTDFAVPESIAAHQVAVFVMCGAGMLGRLAAEYPADFYVDDRVARLPYTKREIKQAVDTLVTLARAAGMDPRQMPPMPRFHNCGIF